MMFYGQQWWLGRSFRAEREVKWIAAQGSGGQRLFIVPDRDLVVMTTFGPLLPAAPGRRRARHAGELHPSIRSRRLEQGINMSLKFSVGDLTIHRIIEQETTFLPALEMLPGLTPEVLAENRGWMQKAGALDANDVLILCFQSYIVKTPHHTILIDSCIGNDKPRPLRPKWNMKTDDTYMRALGRGRLFRRRHRLCHVHASACRSCRLEHAAGERPLGADLPEGALRVRQDRVRLLDRNARQDAGAAVRRQRAAGRRGETGRDRARRLRRSAITRASCRRRATRPAMSPSPSAAARTTRCSPAT